MNINSFKFLRRMPRAKAILRQHQWSASEHTCHKENRWVEGYYAIVLEEYYTALHAFKAPHVADVHTFALFGMALSYLFLQQYTTALHLLDTLTPFDIDNRTPIATHISSFLHAKGQDGWQTTPIFGRFLPQKQGLWLSKSSAWFLNATVEEAHMVARFLCLENLQKHEAAWECLTHLMQKYPCAQHALRQWNYAKKHYPRWAQNNAKAVWERFNAQPLRCAIEEYWIETAQWKHVDRVQRHSSAWRTWSVLQRERYLPDASNPKVLYSPTIHGRTSNKIAWVVGHEWLPFFQKNSLAPGHMLLHSDPSFPTMGGDQTLYVPTQSHIPLLEGKWDAVVVCGGTGYKPVPTIAPHFLWNPWALEDPQGYQYQMILDGMHPLHMEVPIIAVSPYLLCDGIELSASKNSYRHCLGIDKNCTIIGGVLPASRIQRSDIVLWSTLLKSNRQVVCLLRVGSDTAAEEIRRTFIEEGVAQQQLHIGGAIFDKPAKVQGSIDLFLETSLGIGSAVFDAAYHRRGILYPPQLGRCAQVYKTLLEKYAPPTVITTNSAKHYERVATAELALPALRNRRAKIIVHKKRPLALSFTTTLSSHVQKELADS